MRVRIGKNRLDMLILDNNLKISQGKTRICYEHPADPSLIVKVPFPGGEEGILANKHEMKAYQYLMHSHPSLNCISHLQGLVETNAGMGLLAQAIRDCDGRISASIHDIILFQEDFDLPYILEITTQFCNYLRDNDIFIFDLNPKNVVLQLQKNGTYKPIIIDIKSRIDTKEFIPLARYSRYFARKKLERRTTQLIQRTRKLPDKKGSIES